MLCEVGILLLVVRGLSTVMVDGPAGLLHRCTSAAVQRRGASDCLTPDNPSL
jgi:hypothetical protein